LPEANLFDLSFIFKDLPEDSWYRIVEAEKESTITVYPYAGTHEFQLPHDFTIEVIVKKTTRASSAFVCTKPVGYDDLRDETFKNGAFDITLHHGLNYRGYGPEGGNPNPYDIEIKNLILTLS